MCGILGVLKLNGDKIDRNIVNELCNMLSHRGPDDVGIYCNESNNLALAHRRLSIIDLSTGHQPMCDIDNQVWLTYNGEIYNYVEIRNRLLKLGIKFKSKSDTEVIINAYKHYGIQFINKLNGIFAFALYDKRISKLYIVRDYYGIKPLYYSIKNNTIVFSSEISPIKKYFGISELSKYSLYSYFMLRFVPSPNTIYDNISKVRPGHYIEINLNKELSLSEINYDNFRPIIYDYPSESSVINEYCELLENSVKRQIISDVPVGLLLSGGVDSAVIGYLMNKVSRNPIYTYSIGIKGDNRYDERIYARRTSNLLNSKHNDILIDYSTFFEYIFKSIQSVEEPIAITSTPLLYMVCELAAKDVKVVLTGQGADEPLMGYDRYLAAKFLDRKFIKYMIQILHLFPKNYNIQKLINGLHLKNDESRLINIYSVFEINELESNIAYSTNGYLNEVISTLMYLQKETEFLENFAERISYIDLKFNLADELLILADKVSMANSLELRVPFLDIELVRFLNSVSVKRKINYAEKKRIHKKSVTKWLPNEIVYRKKLGFETPISKWFENIMKTKLKDILLSDNSIIVNYMNPELISSLIENHNSGYRDNHRKLFILLNFEIWYNVNILNDYSLYERIVS